MVKKLFRQEMRYYTRSLLPTYLLLLSVALMGRIIQLFESDGWIYSTIRTSSLVAYVVAIIAALGLTVLFCIVRYYKNMFSGEGYLTLTLPVTFDQHLRVKLSAALVTTIATILAVLLSLVVFLTTEWLVELWKAGIFLLKILANHLGFHMGLYATEGVLLVLALIIEQILFFYMCISLGQTFRKNRILAAIGIYYGVYLATQILSTILIIVLGLDWLPLAKLGAWAAVHPFSMVHILLTGGLAVAGLLSTGLYYISRWVLRKRLNLE